MAASSPRIWAIGGGKGGVGKSLFTANLGVALAAAGYRCILLDADLGGANLHTILGAPDPRRTLSDFFGRTVDRLEDVVAPTPVSGLALVSGTRALAEAPHLKHFQKLKLLRHLANLEVDVVLLDLAAGASFNTLDFFLAADEGILVLVPEPTSIENAFHFVKAAFYRRLRSAAREEQVLAAVDEVLRERRERGIRSPRRLLPLLRQRDPLAADLLVREARTFETGLVLNQLQEADEPGLGRSIVRACRDGFGLRLRLLGSIDHDPAVRQALRSRQPSFTLFPHGRLAQGIRRITDELLAEEREPDPLELASEEYRLLGVQPGCRLVDVISAHKRVTARYSNASLATQAALDDDERRAMIRRLDIACQRIIQGYSLGMPPEPESAPPDLGY